MPVCVYKGGRRGKEGLEEVQEARQRRDEEEAHSDEPVQVSVTAVVISFFGDK